MSASISDPAKGPAKARTSAREPVKVQPDELRVSVRDALAMATPSDIVEVYIGWPQTPVLVASRLREVGRQPWADASLEMRKRVTNAVQPLVDAGWQIDGTPVGAMRWDTSLASQGQQYDGCWIRMRSRNA